MNLNLGKNLLVAAAFCVTWTSLARAAEANAIEQFKAALDQSVELSKTVRKSAKFKIHGHLAERTQLYALAMAMSSGITDQCFQQNPLFGKIPLMTAVAETTVGSNGQYELEIPLAIVQNDGCKLQIYKIEFYAKYNFNDVEVKEMIQRYESIAAGTTFDYSDLYKIHYAGLDTASDGGGFVRLEILPPKDQISQFTSPELDYTQVIDAKMYDPAGRQSLSWYNPVFTDAPRQFVIMRSFDPAVLNGKDIEFNVIKAGKAPKN